MDTNAADARRAGAAALIGSVATAVTLLAALMAPAGAGPGGTFLSVEAASHNHVSVAGFAAGDDNVTVAFTDPDGGPTCPDVMVDNSEGVSPSCDLQAGWIASATDGVTTAEVTIQDARIRGTDAAHDTVTVAVSDVDGSIVFGCTGTATVNGPGGSSRAVPSEGVHTVDFSVPGPCAGAFDDSTVDLADDDEIHLNVTDDDGDRTFEVHTGPVFDCPTDDPPFLDVSMSSFAYGDIGCIYGLGVTTGTSATTYSPGDFVTREQMAAFLARLFRTFGDGCDGGAHPFLDVSMSSFAFDDISCIFTLGVTTGTSATTYSPGDLVTREQMASFLARLYSVMLGSVDHPVLGWVAPTPFLDVLASSFASDDVGRIYGLGITTGTSATTYSPGDFVTREQMAAFLARLIRVINGLPPTGGD